MLGSGAGTLLEGEDLPSRVPRKARCFLGGGRVYASLPRARPRLGGALCLRDGGQPCPACGRGPRGCRPVEVESLCGQDRARLRVTRLPVAALSLTRRAGRHAAHHHRLRLRAEHPVRVCAQPQSAGAQSEQGRARQRRGHLQLRRGPGEFGAGPGAVGARAVSPAGHCRATRRQLCAGRWQAAPLLGVPRFSPAPRRAETVSPGVRAVIHVFPSAPGPVPQNG